MSLVAISMIFRVATIIHIPKGATVPLNGLLAVSTPR